MENNINKFHFYKNKLLMTFFRSQTMGYYNLIVPRESAWTVMNELADLDCIHFIDYDPT